MLLKKHADKSGDAPENGAWPLSHVEVQHAGPVQSFTPRFLQSGMEEGWISMSKGKITLDTAKADGTPAPVVYKIDRAPGAYCCHCNQKLDGGNEIAQAHIEEKHPGIASPDESNPAGYRIDNFYACTKEE